jgi:predicted PurR-regulated permease PerM
MVIDRWASTMLTLCAAILVVVAAYFARSVFAPVVFSLIIIALAWPLQRTLQVRIPRLLALAITTLATLIIIAAVGSLVVWGVARAGYWLVANGARFQALYSEASDWLEGHGLYAAGMLADQFNVPWLIRVFQSVTGRVQNLLSFAVVTYFFVILGLLEVNETRQRLKSLAGSPIGEILLHAGADIAAKLQKYMLVRSLVSILTGVSVWGFAYVMGLDLALEWGVIAFALNYIPVIGPLVATLLPTIFAIAQFESWQVGVTVFLGLNLIQFLGGSCLEPRIAGTALSISPFMVLLAVIFWGFMWGIAGAFVGVPILIAFTTFCEQHPPSQWMAHLLSSGDRSPPSAKDVKPG